MSIVIIQGLKIKLGQFEDLFSRNKNYLKAKGEAFPSLHSRRNLLKIARVQCQSNEFFFETYTKQLSFHSKLWKLRLVLPVSTK